MKKTLIMFSALLALLCGLMFTGCQHSYIADEDTWYKTNKQFSVGEAELDVNLWFYYSQKSLTITTKDQQKIDCKPGLTIVFSPNIDTGLVSTNIYTIKNFPSSETVNVDEIEGEVSDSEMKIAAKGTMMDALYIANKEDFKSSAGKEPSVFELYKYVEDISEIGKEAGFEKYKNVGWKTLIKEAINQIL